MSLPIIILSILVIAGFGVVIYLMTRKKQDQSMLMMQNQIQEMNRTLDSKLGESVKVLQTQFGQSAKIIREVTEKLTKLDETNRQVVNFADQLQNLQEILKNPKQRGILGEYMLETVLKNVLPPQTYQMQYKFKNGEIVDAVIFVRDRIIPIDAKFSLENYNRIIEERNAGEREKLEKAFKQDLKNRIDETAKYIRPEEKTLGYAFMFIPAEAIYYDLLINKVGAIKLNTRDLIEYAFRDRHVIIVSPTTFYAYLQMFLQGLKALEIEKSTQEIIKRVEKLAKHMANYDIFLQRLGKNLGATVGSYNSAYQEFKKMDKDVVKIADKGGEVEPTLLEKPHGES